MKTILALSKMKFDQMMEYNAIDDSNVEEKDVMIISICSPQEDDQPGIASLSRSSWFKTEHSNVKILYFGDYGEAWALNGGPNAFTQEQADELYDFILKNKNKSTALIHCGGGYSRSGAISLFVFDNFGDGNYSKFKQKNPQIMPNAYVLRLLNYAKRKYDLNR